MFCDSVISIKGLRKVFPVYSKPYHRLLQMLFPNKKEGWYQEFEAIKSMDMEVRSGETVGIVGRNGSGKSTLLQLICGILSPSGGEVVVRGRIAALLELGAGFNPDFTGRENVYLNGSILGFEKKQLDAKFEDIVRFADIGGFIDQPVKTYSSGMYVRLAFSVAIHVDPDILIVDEALSVGDEAFQRKCFARIEEIKRAGATILFVSHSAGTVVDLCDRAVLMDRGELLAQGAPKQIVSIYQKLLFTPEERMEQVRSDIRIAGSSMDISVIPDSLSEPQAHGDEDKSGATFEPGLVPETTVCYERLGAEIIDPRLETLSGRRVNVLVQGEEYVYRYQVRLERSLEGVRFGMLIRTITGIELAGAVTARPDGAFPVLEAESEIKVSFTFKCNLAEGAYFLNAGVLARNIDGEYYVDRRIDVAMFKVMPNSQRLATALVDLEFRPATEVAV
ncbi:ABC transporter ATP-binding protein [Lysobacteraceae bacterium NML03-0222]|nr:ABC transporter ATP-binding protein [Xanthomonadaceae bacterium NML03-0222]